MTLIVAETVSAILERFEPQLRAIVLTGSMARGEATFVEVPGGWDTLGDCEMVLVFKSHEPLPRSIEVGDMQTEIALRLQQRCVACPIGLSPVHPNYLVTLPPRIYGYELRTCGRVVWGDTTILASIPAFSPRDIPLEDAWRMICNRIIEQLAVTHADAKQTLINPHKANYRTAKLCLDLATSLLLFCGEYAPTYRERSARLQRLSDKMATKDGLPFPLRPFAALVDKLTCWKLSPSSGVLDREPFLLPRVWDYARRLWRWELLRLTAGQKGLPDSDLMRGWMRSQPLHGRIRSWARLARKNGGLSSWQEWPRWVRLGLRSSPRYWIYAAGSELFFRIPSLAGEVTGACPDRSLQTWREWLPVRPKQAAGTPISWNQLASEVTWNYRQFLMETIA
jgi:hypothetical protein